MLSRDIGVRRFSKTRLFTAGRILHIASRKKTKAERFNSSTFFYKSPQFTQIYFRKSHTGGPTFEMRWATAEDFMELKVMPRMFLDHLPENVYKTLDTLLKEQKEVVGEEI